MWSRFVIWPQEVTLARWTQPSGPLCLWQCFFFRCTTSPHQDRSTLSSSLTLLLRWRQRPRFVMAHICIRMMVWCNLYFIFSEIIYYYITHTVICSITLLLKCEAHIYNVRVKCVVFSRNRKFAKLTQWNMQYIPCNSAILAQETLFLTQKTLFAQRSPKSA